MKVLIEQEDDGLYIGRTEADAPEVDGEVHVTSAHPLTIGGFTTVRITGATEHDLEGTAL